MGKGSVDDLIAKRQQLNAKIKAERGKLKGVAKKRDTRRKVLTGAFVLEQAERDPAIQQWLMRGLTWFLTRPDDRTLFPLGPQLVADKASAADAPRAPEMPGAFTETAQGQA